MRELQQWEDTFPGAGSGADENLPGAVASGLILRETVAIERCDAGEWGVVASGVPATLAPASLRLRIAMEPVTHRLLARLWMPAGAPLRDGDRVVREGGERWLVRGSPDAGPGARCVHALVESEADDGMFSGPAA